MTFGNADALEIKLYTIPHLEVLTDGWEISGGQRHGSTFTKQKTQTNFTHFTSNRVSTVRF